MKFKQVEVDIRAELLRLEKSFNSSNYKFGVLFCKKGQDENQMFSNSGINIFYLLCIKRSTY